MQYIVTFLLPVRLVLHGQPHPAHHTGHDTRRGSREDCNDALIHTAKTFRRYSHEDEALITSAVRKSTEKTVPVFNQETERKPLPRCPSQAGGMPYGRRRGREAFREVRLSAYRRYEIILKAANLMRERTEEFAAALSAEAGKPLRDARGEIGRAYQTLILSAEEAKRLKGETIQLAGAPGCQNKLAFTIRQPLGVVCAITPFNFPVNLAAPQIGRLARDRATPSSTSRPPPRR